MPARTLGSARLQASMGRGQESREYKDAVSKLRRAYVDYLHRQESKGRRRQFTLRHWRVWHDEADELIQIVFAEGYSRAIEPQDTLGR